MRRAALAALMLVVAGASCSRHATPASVVLPVASAAPAHYTIRLEEKDATSGRVRTERAALRAPHGAIVFRLTVPVLGLHQYPARMGVSEGVLALGPGVYRGSAIPGRGHVVTAGHDVTPVGPWSHGPYRYLERLRPGDRASILVGGRTVRYELVKLVQVRPSNTEVLRSGYDLTMTSCYPPGSAEYRLVAQWKETK